MHSLRTCTYTSHVFKSSLGWSWWHTLEVPVVGVGISSSKLDIASLRPAWVPWNICLKHKERKKNTLVMECTILADSTTLNWVQKIGTKQGLLGPGCKIHPLLHSKPEASLGYMRPEPKQPSNRHNVWFRKWLGAAKWHSFYQMSDMIQK